MRGLLAMHPAKSEFGMLGVGKGRTFRPSAAEKL